MTDTPEQVRAALLEREATDPDAWRKPPPHFKPDPRWQRQPQSDDEWDANKDTDRQFNAKRRLAFAGDVDDPRAPECMGTVRAAIDHVVPLKEAWESGAWNWSPEKRRDYANDLVDENHLMAVSASANRQKGDRDPMDWMPDRNKCRYLRAWVSIKERWELSADQAEADEIARRMRYCH